MGDVIRLDDLGKCKNYGWLEYLIISPEIIDRRLYSLKFDMWWLGVILYELYVYINIYMYIKYIVP